MYKDCDYDADTPFDGVSPLAILDHWLHVANKTEINDPSAMAIATIGADGYPQNRMVLCRGVTEHGIIFYTNKNGDKGQSLAKNDTICALFHWKSMRKQVRFTGHVRMVDTTQNQTYFNQRSPLSQLGAWASAQSQPLDSRTTLIKQVAHMEQKFKGVSPIPCPDFWGGYEIIPEKIEFWCDGKDRLHNRFLWKKISDTDTAFCDPNAWDIQRLYP